MPQGPALSSQGSCFQGAPLAAPPAFYFNASVFKPLLVFVLRFKAFNHFKQL